MASGFSGRLVRKAMNDSSGADLRKIRSVWLSRSALICSGSFPIHALTSVASASKS
jgi:hypothetical protein